MAETLDQTECRILASLVEKQLTTPEYYPLTINALVAACNQKNNREPVMSLDEATVSSAVERLRDRNLIYVFYGSSARVPKYKHMLPGVYELEPDETALVAVLMLRGPQTVGELRERTSRMHQFASLGEVQAALDRLAVRDKPLVAKLERAAGQKDARYAHLLSGRVTVEPETANSKLLQQTINPSTETELLRKRIEDLETKFEEFRKQFE